MRVLVAGATGLLGGAAARSLLASGHSVRALVRTEAHETIARGFGAQPVRGDVLDAESVLRSAEGCEAIAHLAWRVPIGNRLRAGDWAANDAVRRDGTAHLLNAARAHGVGIFVLGSTHLVYRGEDEHPIGEEAALSEHPFVRGAIDAEALVRGAASPAMRAVVLRFATVHGADAAQTTTLLENVRRGTLPLLLGGRSYWSMIHVEDAAMAVPLALRAPDSDVFNVCDNEPSPHGEIVRWLAEQIGARKPVGGSGWLLRLATGKENAALLETSLRLSTMKIRDRLGFRPAYPSYREIFAQIVSGRTPA